MIRVVSFNFQGAMYPVFIDDTVTGYSGKDVMSRPGIYDEICGEEFSLPIAELQGSIDGYSTKCMALLAVVEPGQEEKYQLQDCTNQVKQLLTVPDTGAKMLLNKFDEDTRQFLNTALEVIHFYEKVTEETKVFLPESAFQYVDEAVAKKMRSTRHVYVLRNSDNQEIVQKDCTSPYGVVLPSVEDLHSEVDVTPKALDILRVIAPCRKPVGDGGAFQYNGIYHTPYYRIDPKLRGAVPSYLDFLRGYPKNDTLEIQPHERHMRDNLRTFVQADVARYVSEIITALYLSTHAGQRIKRLLACHNDELLHELVASVTECNVGGITCSISYTALSEVMTDGWSMDKMAQLVKDSIEYDDDAIRALASEGSRTHIVDIENLPFVFELSDSLKDELTQVLIDSGLITRAMLEFLISLCLKAYEVNWGHSGATRAIPRFVVQSGISAMNDVLGAYLSQTIGGIQAPAGTDFSILYETQFRSSDDDDDDSDLDDEIFTSLDRYITNDTAMKIRAETASDFFSSNSTGAETSESAIVEYWRKVDGEGHLSYFISSAFTATGDVNVLFEAFIKLMRWGSIKPSLLVFQDHSDIRTVFDLNTGKEIPNTAVVDESQLILSNGCHYSLECLLTAQDVNGATPAIVGFLLSKNYGVKKYFLASWVTIGEMVNSNSIDVDALKTVTQIPLSGDNVVEITQFENSGYALLPSNANIEQGLKLNIQPVQLSEIALLLTPGVLRSAEYLKSKQTTMVVTTKDRQYQILSAYCSAIRSVYATDGSLLNADTISTVDLSALSVKIYQAFNDSGKSAVPDVNQVRANQAVMSMQLTDDIDIKYSDVPLEGKFAIISDVDVQSNFPSIEFTDPTMQQVARKVRDRIVLLLLETNDAFVLCRKDISASELLVQDHKIEHRKYSMFEPVIKSLKAGRPVNISSARTGNKHPAVLHESLREFM